MPGTKMPAPYLPDQDILSLDGAENDWGKAVVELNGDSTAMLDGLRDYLWNIKGKVNIDSTIKAYFDENGYDFESSDEDDFDEVVEQQNEIRKEKTATKRGGKRKRTQHECNICEKVFNKPFDLARHMRIHTNEKPYECDVCEKRFRQSGTLRYHKRTQH